MINILGGMLGSPSEVKYDANGSAARSAATSSCPENEPPAEVEGSAVRMDGSNSRVLSSVRGTFSASRF